jgi:hypothetical protein
MPIIVNNSPLKASDPDLILWLDEGSGQSNIWVDKSQYKNSATITQAIFDGGLITDGTSNNNQSARKYALGTLSVVPTTGNINYTISVTFESFGTQPETPGGYLQWGKGQCVFSIPPTTLLGPGMQISYFPFDSTIGTKGSVSFAVNNTQYFYSPNNSIDYKQKVTATVTYNRATTSLRFYINGLEVPVTAVNGISQNLYTPPGAWPNQYILGGWNVSGYVRPLNGKIYNVSMFKRTLAPQEVYDFYVNKPLSISTKKASSDIILYLSDRGTSTGWGDNSIYSNGAIILGNATFSGGLVTPGLATLDGAEGRFTTLPGENFTVSALVCMYGLGSTGISTIIGTSPNSLGAGVTRGRGFIFALSSDRQLWFLSDNGGGPQSAANLFSFGETFLATVVVTNPNGTQSVSFYKNGEFVSNHLNSLFQPVTMTYNDPTYRVGTWGFPSFTNQLNGKVSNLIVYNRPLSDSEVKDLYLRMPSAYKSSISTLNQAPHGGKLLHIDAGNPKSYYLTGTTVNDLSVYGRNGTFSSFGSSGLPTFGTLNGGYFSFKDGSFIGFNPTGLPTAGESTIIVWARVTQLNGSWQTIFIYGGSDALQSRSIMIDPGGGIGVFLDKFRGVQTSNNFVQLNEWVQIVQVNKSTNVSNPTLILYLNGRLISSAQFSRLTVATKARLGRNDIWLTQDNVNTYEFPFYGDVGELVFYDRALDPQEIYQDYKVKRSRYELPEVVRLPGDVIPTIPTVQTLTVNGITTTTALSGVLVNNDGYSFIFDSGIIWSTSSASLQPGANPTNLSTKTTDGSGLMTNLSPNTTYYVVAYAQNSLGIGYGQILSFTTTSIVIPIVQNVRGTSLTSTQIRATASVVSLGNDANISQRGFAYHTASFSEATGGIYPRVSESGSFGLATYSLDITQLSGNTNYWIRAFATNTAGTDYSNDILQIITPQIPTVTILLGGISTTFDSFTIPIVTTGTSRIRQGIVYKLTQDQPNVGNDLDASQSITDNGGNINTSHSVGSLASAQTWYVWGFVETSDGVYYFTNTYVEVTTQGSLSPPVVTIDIDSFLENPENTANINGSVVLTNGTVTEHGFVFGSTQLFASGNNVTIETYSSILSLSTPIFDGEIFQGIQTLDTVTYYVRSYATNEIGTGYSAPITITILGLSGIVLPQIFTRPAVQISAGVFQLFGDIVSMGQLNQVYFGYGLKNINDSTFIEKAVDSTELDPTVGTIYTLPQEKIKYSTTNWQDPLSDGTYQVYAYASAVGKPAIRTQGNTVTFTVGAAFATVTIDYPKDLIVDTSPIFSLKTTLLSSPTDVLGNGFEWSTSEFFSTSEVTTTLTTNNNVEFSATIPGPGNSDLLSDTIYYVRAFVDNVAGRAYSNEIAIYTPKTFIVENPFVNLNVGDVQYNAQFDSNPVPTFITDKGHIWAPNSQITLFDLNNDIGFERYTVTGGGNLDGWSGNLFTTPQPGSTYFILPFVRLINEFGKMYVYGAQKSVTYEEIGLQLYLDAGLALSYPGSGTNWIDLAPYNRNGTIQSTSAVTYNSAGLASNLAFDGTVQSSSLVVTEGYTGVSGNTDRTVSIWIKPESVQSAEVLGWGVEANLQMFDILIFNGQIGIHLFGTNLISPVPVTVGQWQNFTFVYDGQERAVFTFKNGQFGTKQSIVSSAGIDTSNINTLRIGNGIYRSGLTTGYGSFQGLISIVRIWNQVLNDVQINEEYASFYTRYLTTTVVTGNAASVNNNSFIVQNSTVTSTSQILQRGIQYSLFAGMDPSSPEYDTPTTGTFNITLTDLQSGTNYFFRAFAQTSNGEFFYGVIKQQQTTSTATPPTVTLGTTPTIGGTNVSFANSNVTSSGSSTVTARGVVWSTSPNPTVALSTKTTNGMGTGTYNSDCTPLTKGVLYYFRAYATNSAGTGYSNEVSYTTLIEPTLTTNAFTFSNFGQITTTDGTNWRMTASASGLITSNGGSTITNYGIIYSQTNNPTLTTPGVITEPGVSPISVFPFSFLLIMTNLSENTLYYYRAYSTNAVGTGYGSVISFTTLRRPTINSSTSITQLAGPVTLTSNVSSAVFGNIDLYGVAYVAGFKYGLSSGGTLTEVIADSSYTRAESLLAPPSNNFTANVTLNTVGGWLIRTFVRTSIQEFQSDLTITIQSAPVVELSSLGGGTPTSVDASGRLVTTGGFTITERGFVYSLTPTPTVANFKKSETFTGFVPGNFGGGLLNISPLITGNAYYIRAFVKTSTNVNYYSSDELIYETGGGLRLHFDAGNLSSYSGSGTTVNDLSGLGNHGTLTTLAPTWEPSNLGVFRFNGVLNKLINTTYKGVTGSTPRTLSFWFKPNTTADQEIMGWGTPGISGQLWDVLQVNGPGIHIWSSSNISRVTIQANVWQNVIFTYDSFNIRSYLNGSTTPSATTLTGLNTGSATNFKIGDGNYVYNPFNGDISVVKIWDKVLTPPQIQSEYNTIVSRYNLPGVSTGVTSSITTTSINIINNEVFYGGTSPVTARGVAYVKSVNPTNPTIANSTVQVGSGTGSYNASLTGLDAGSTYQIRAYATNTSGTTYGKRITVGTSLPFSVSNYVITNYFFTSSGSGTLTGQMKLSFVVTGGVGLVARTNFGGIENGTSTTITTSPQTITSQIGIDYADTPGTPENRRYDAIVVWNSVPYVMDSQVIECENFYLNTGSSYNSSTDAFVGSIGFENRSGRTITQMGIAWKNKTLSPTGNVLDNPEQYTTTVATSATNFSNGGNYNFSISASSFANTQQITFRPYLIVDGYKMYAFNGETTLTKTAAVVVPTVTYTAPSTLAATTANPGGNVTADGGATVTERGIVWSSTVNPPTIESGTKTQVGSGTGAFTSALTNLTPNTTYYVRAYAINSAGPAYHSTTATTFITVNIPVVNSGSIINPYSNQAQVSNVTITWTGTQPITQRGVVWSTSTNPTVALTTKTTDGTGTGTFTTTIQTLNQNTLYYIRAYVINSVGTYYGNEITFTTPAHPVVAGLSLSSVDYILATNGQLQYYNFSAGQLTPSETYVNSYHETRLRITGSMSSLWKVGFVYSSSVSNINQLVKGAVNTSFTEITAYKSREITGAREIFDGPYPIDANLRPWYTRAYITDGTSITYSTITREVNIPKLIPNAIYNGDGTTTATITVKSMQPGTTPLPVINGGGVAIHESLQGGTPTTGAVVTEYPSTPFTLNASNQFVSTIDIKTLISNNGYYRVYGYVTYQSVDGPIKVYSLAYPLQKINGFAVVNTTTAVSAITSNSASSGGSWTWNGGTNITAYGVCWATTQNPTIANSRTNIGTSTLTSLTFTSNLTGLVGGTTYYVRAYVTNSSGTSYGPQVSFTTTSGTTVTLSTLATLGVNIGGSYILGLYCTITGGTGITSQGIVYSQTSTNGDPLIGGIGVTRINFTGVPGTTPFTVDIPSGLIHSTNYTIKSFVIIGGSTIYSSPRIQPTNSIQLRITTNTTELGPAGQPFYDYYSVSTLEGILRVPFDAKFFNASIGNADYGYVALKGTGTLPNLSNATHIQSSVGDLGPGDFDFSGFVMQFNGISPPSLTQGVWSVRLFYRFPQTTGIPIYSSLVQIYVPFFTMTYQAFTPNSQSYTFNITTKNPTTEITIVQRGFAWSITNQPTITSNANRTMVPLSGTIDLVTYVFTNPPGTYYVGFWVLLSNGQRWWYFTDLVTIQLV